MEQNKPATIEADKIPIAFNQPECRVSINAEYFRPKFETILSVEFMYDRICMATDVQEILNRLIDCLKNPEDK